MNGFYLSPICQLMFNSNDSFHESRYKCKGCKEEGRRKGEYLGYLHDTGSNPVSVEQTLRVSSDLK